MARQTEILDAVKTMRRIRDNLSRRFKNMTFAQQKQAMQEGQKRRPARTQAKIAPKRTT